jgi:short-subunit dehydrogenase
MADPFVWVTGASSGIGMSVTEKLAQNNYHVLASSRRRPELKVENEQNILFCKSDITSYPNVVDAVKMLSDKSGYVDCLINNAGITSFKSAESDSIEEIKNIINTNLLGAIYAIKAVLPGMIEKKRGTIINILSVVTHKIFTDSSAYSASKSGLLAYTNVLREEVRKYNIRVINIIPGATATPIWGEKILDNKSNRMMKPKELADMILQILGNTNSVVTEEIRVRPITGDL